VECVQRLQLVLLVVLGHVGWWIIGHRRDGLHHGLLAEPRHLDELGDGDAGVRVGVKQPGNEPTRVRGEPRRKGGDVGLRWIAVHMYTSSLPQATRCDWLFSLAVLRVASIVLVGASRRLLGEPTVLLLPSSPIVAHKLVVAD
jgi:hypothetical protein